LNFEKCKLKQAMSRFSGQFVECAGGVEKVHVGKLFLMKS